LSDNGCGIDESLLDKIFIPFFTTKEGGNGIGLSLSRQIIRKLNGKISVQSVKNKGSVFIVEI
jgi:signal transduction histidine kinase